MSSPSDVDLRFCEFIEHAWEEGDSRNLPIDARSGLMHFIPGLRDQFPGSQRLLKAWSKHELPRRATPLPTEYAVALAGVALVKRDLQLALLI